MHCSILRIGTMNVGVYIYDSKILCLPSFSYPSEISFLRFWAGISLQYWCGVFFVVVCPLKDAKDLFVLFFITACASTIILK